MTHVLCVDDEEALLDLEKDFLEASGELRIETATSASEAIRLLESKPFDAVISDYHMPGMDGIELLRAIRSWSYMPFILFTGKGREETIIDALNSGADFYVKKGSDLKIQCAELQNLVIQAVARHRAEEGLQYNFRRFAGLLENSSDLIVLVDRNGMVRFVTPSVRRVIGYEPSEVIDHSLSQFIDPKQVELLRDVVIRTLARDIAPGTIQFRVRHKDGSWKELEAIGSARRQGDEMMLVANVRDVTERHRMEAELRLSEEQFRATMDQSPVGTVTADLRGRYLRANQAFCHMVGYAEQELVGRPFTDITEPECAAEERSGTERVIRGEVDIFHMEKRYRRKDGGMVWADAHITLIRDVDRQPIFLLAILEDTTERKAAEEALQQANAKLGILNGITGHDIFNQMIVVNGLLQLCKAREKDPDLAAYFDKMSRATANVEEQITFAKDYQELGIQAPAWVSIGCQAAEVFALQRPQGMALEDGTNGVEILTDPLVRKVSYNLIDNSMRHGGHVTRVRMSSNQVGDAMLIVYEDDGKGIDAEDKKRLFEKGFGKNTGYGLFLIREILAITGITIEERGQAGRGVRFEMLVPPGAWRKASP
jgi:PAS domain S-box-containing protein